MVSISHEQFIQNKNISNTDYMLSKRNGDFFIAVHQHQKRLFFIAVHQQLCSTYNTKRSIKGESCPFCPLKKQKWARETWTGEGRAENHRKN